MSKFYKLPIKNNDILEEMNNFFKRLFEQKLIDLLLLPQASPTQNSVMQTLVNSPQAIKAANPFAPILLQNCAKLLSQLTFDKPKEKIGAVLRSCEIRAAIELAKLKQVNLDNLIIIGVDCLGTYEVKTHQKLIAEFKDLPNLTKAYLAKSGQAEAPSFDNAELRLVCQGCEYPNPGNFDIAINFLGCDTSSEILIQLSEKIGPLKSETLGLIPCEADKRWLDASQVCLEKRIKFRDNLFKEVLTKIKDIKGFLKELEHCRRCYNCRKVCPICYCRECIFDSLIFEHNSEQYFSLAKRKEKLRMPTDTLLFHLTRMVHMAVSCVGCGQCSSACPNEIPIAKFFKTIGFKVQEIFDYKPGNAVTEEIPQATFKEDEFEGSEVKTFKPKA